MNKTKETKNKAYDLLYRHLMSNIKHSQADQKLYRLLLEKYREERKENEHY